NRHARSSVPHAKRSAPGSTRNMARSVRIAANSWILENGSAKSPASPSLCLLTKSLTTRICLRRSTRIAPQAGQEMGPPIAGAPKDNFTRHLPEKINYAYSSRATIAANDPQTPAHVHAALVRSDAGFQPENEHDHQ